jgi:hypothetical protein
MEMKHCLKGMCGKTKLTIGTNPQVLNLKFYAITPTPYHCCFIHLP